MRFFHVLMGVLILTASAFAVAPAGAEECKFCKALEQGIGSPPGKPTTCLVRISAPTYGGEVALDIRDADGKSIWDKPRIKQAAPGIVTYNVGCSQLEKPTEQVYLCVDGRKGGDGQTYHSIRLRSAGTLDEALQTRRLDMCLTGKGCPKWHGVEWDR